MAVMHFVYTVYTKGAVIPLGLPEIPVDPYSKTRSILNWKPGRSLIGDGPSRARLPACAGVRVCVRRAGPRVRACGRAGPRVCGRAGPRVCGRAGVRACGRAGVRACGRAGVPARAPGPARDGIRGP